MARTRTIQQEIAETVRLDAQWRKDRRILLLNFKHLLDTDIRALNLVKEIFGYTGFYNVNISTDSSVQHTEGKRAVGKEIIELLYEIDPALYPKLISKMGENDHGRPSTRTDFDVTGERSTADNGNNYADDSDDTSGTTVADADALSNDDY